MCEIPQEQMELLQALCVLNRDDGTRFTNTGRLDEIAARLWDTGYRRVGAQGLFHLYARRPLRAYRGPVTVISTHVDCERGISRCFTRTMENGLLRGTYDNAITNAAALWLMLRGELPENVLVAFTGDEEHGSAGARQLTALLREKAVPLRCVIVLDVTDMGWEEAAHFTVENDFWDDGLGRAVMERVCRTAQAGALTWRFVPSDPDEVPDYVPAGAVIHEEAEEDESWEYDERDVPCFSLCLPVLGEMHSDMGVLARAASFAAYPKVLQALAEGLA